MILVVSRSPLMALAGPLIGGFGLPNFVLKFLANRRLKKFNQEFPNAIDIIIRGVKAGLPLNDTLRIIASEGHEPVRSEFRQIVESQALGLTVYRGGRAFAPAHPYARSEFFRDRRRHPAESGRQSRRGARQSVHRHARTQENARQGESGLRGGQGLGLIIGLLPVIVALLLYLTSPHFIELLWTTKQGRFMLIVAAAAWRPSGSFVMKSMIDFEI